MKKICVYCGSNFGNKKIYEEYAVLLGKEIAQNGIGLVYGGSNVGLMGVIADTVLKNNQEVTGVITENLANLEISHHGLSKLHVVKTMHQRKTLMAELSDYFIAMPGGFGTFEEIFEVVTWSQLGIHNKPCGLLNVDGFYDNFLKFLDKSVNEGFIRTEHRSLLISDINPKDLIKKLLTAKIEYIPKLVGKENK